MDVIVTTKNRGGRGRSETTNEVHPEPAASEPVDRDEAQATGTDDFMTRIKKLIPAEVTAAYTVLVAIAAAATDASARYAVPIAMLLGTVFTVLSLWQAGRTHNPPVKPHKRQYLLGLFAFWAWGATVRDPLDGFGFYLPQWILLFAIVSVPTFGAFWMGSINSDAPEQS